MRTDFKDRRLSPRSDVSEVVRIRPIDPLQVEKICNTANQSQTGLYFLTNTGSYVAGMEVSLTRDLAQCLKGAKRNSSFRSPAFF